MPQAQIEYDKEEVCDLIAADVRSRFGLNVAADDVSEGSLDGQWIVNIEDGKIDAAKAK